jgi:hypothetical protein
MQDDRFKNLCRPAQEDAVGAIIDAARQNRELAAAIGHMITSASIFLAHLPIALEVGTMLQGVRLVVDRSHEPLEAAESRLHKYNPKFGLLGIAQLHGAAVQVGAVTVRDPRHDVTGRVVTLVYGGVARGLAVAFAQTVSDRMSLNHPLVRRALRRAAALPPTLLAQKCQIA